MDVSMYGNHHTSHPTGYQPSEIGSSGYTYFSSHHNHHHHLNQTESVYGHPSPTSNTTSISTSSSSSTPSHLYHPHLYSPSAAEYGITTAGHNTSSEDSYYDSGSSVHNFYNSQSTSHPTNVIQDHIISSDNGLSYTNLDYMYGQNNHGNNVYLSPDDKIALAHSYNLTGDDILGPAGHTHHHSSGTSTSTWHQHHHTNSNYLDSPLAHQVVMPSISGQNQLRQLTSPSGRMLHDSPAHQQQQQQQQQSQQPTYKWMQVKRNVPKPQSK